MRRIYSARIPKQSANSGGISILETRRSGEIKRQVRDESEILGHMAPLGAVKTRYYSNVGRDRCRIGK